MRSLFLCALVLCFAGSVYPKEKKKDVLELELQSLSETLQGVRDSLESEIAARYSFKQHTVEQRETDKEEYEQFREKQEAALTGLSKIKEEVLVKEQNLGDANKNAREKQEEWKLVKNSFDEMMQKDADGIVEAFPMDIESRRGDIETVRRLFRQKGDPIGGWDAYIRYRISTMKEGRAISVTQQKLLPDDGAPRMFSIARFGNVFAYCMDTANQIYMIRQTGRLGADRFAMEPVLSQKFKESLLDVLPKWIQENNVDGTVMTEVMQNEQAKLLVAGKKKTWFQGFVSELKAGGWVMIPLLLLPFWALGLALHKAMQFLYRRRKFTRHLKTVFAMLEKRERAQALEYVKKNKGLMARILEVCLESENRRDRAENGVRKLISQEAPVLNRNLNTLAVIAGAAPLVGLLGTISGMITLFAAVTYYGTGDPKFLAGGISEALITAKTGLAVAIPTLFAHDYLRGRKERLLNDIEAMAFSALDTIVPEP